MNKTEELQRCQANPDSLNQLSLSELRALWSRSCPKIPPPPHRCLLERDLAFVAQSGGTKLPRETDALIRAAMKVASVSRIEGDQPIRAMPKGPKAANDLPVGARLVREWGGKTHEVTALGGGWFQYQGQSYKSLTQVAKVITGAHWSGPCFFGLHRFRRKA